MDRVPVMKLAEHAQNHNLMFGPDKMRKMGELLGFIDILNREPGRYCLEDVMMEMNRLLGLKTTGDATEEDEKLYKAYLTICMKWAGRIKEYYEGLNNDKEKIKR